MKTTFLLVAASALLASSCVFAQTYPATSVPPPPGINDPGVKAVEPAPKATGADAAAQADHPLNLKPQALPAMRDDDRAQAGRDKSLPDIKVREDGGNTIQEYSRNGRVYMVVVTPKSGIAQTYMVDPQGRLVDEHGVKPVRPVMYKVLEWGKSRPATDSTEAPSDAGNP